MPNIFKARGSDFKAATIRIYRSANATSYIQLPIPDGH